MIAARAARNPAASSQLGLQQTVAASAADTSMPDMFSAIDSQKPQPAAQAAPASAADPSQSVPNGQAVIPASFGDDVPGVPVTGTGSASIGHKLVIMGIIFVVLLALGAGAYFVFFSKKDASVAETTKKSQASADSKAVDMAGLTAMTFVAPDLTAFHKSTAASNETFSSYLTTDETCGVSFGTVTAVSLPGTTADEIVSLQIKSLKDQGYAVTGPSVGTALVLKDAADSSKTYKMPTLIYSFTKDTMHAISNYSIVILKGGDRVVVDRSCIDKTGAEVSTDNVSNMNAKAKELKVKVGS